MSQFQITSAVKVEKDNYEGYYLTLKNDKGMELKIKDDTTGKTVPAILRLNNSYVLHLLKRKQVDVDALTNSQVQQLIDTASLTANISIKKKGQEFVASEYTMVPDPKNAGSFIPAKAGQTYQVQETGLYLDYDDVVSLNLNYQVLNQIEMMRMQLAMMMKNQTA